MKSLTKYILLIAISILSACHYAPAQSVSSISGRCQTPYQKIYQSIIASASGDLIYTPCTTRASIFYGNVDFSNATVTGISGTISGGTVNKIPYYTSATALAPASWLTVSTDSLTVQGSSAFKFSVNATNTGGITLGDMTNPTVGMSLDKANNLIRIANNGRYILNSLSGTSLVLGDPFTSGGGTRFTITDTSGFTFAQTNNLATLTVTGVNNYVVQKTNSPTVGNVTIDKPFGQVNVGVGDTAIIVSNNIVTANSLIFVTAQTDDATCKNFHVGSKGGGGFEIIADVACTIDTAVAFWVVN